MRHSRSWAPSLVLSVIACVFSPGLFSQELQLPADYGIDLQLAETGRSRIMNGSSDITGTAANETGDEVFYRLISAYPALPYAWKLTLVNNSVVNAGSTAGGKVYVDGGMLPILRQNKGLWAAVLSHEAAHTARRHQVRVVMQELYIQRMIQYYRARAAAGDNSANWSLVGFATASKIALKKLEREQEHDADQQGMLLMARSGYHPDFVFALHHLLLMNTGEQSNFAAFFSDHPRWETRDQRSDKVYSDALAEFNRLWPDPATSPGGAPPVVAFLGQPEARENKELHTADLVMPAYCRNSEAPVDLLVMFSKNGKPVKSADPRFADQDGNLVIRERADCLEKNETTPIRISVPASAVAREDRSLKGIVYVGDHSEPIAASKEFDIHLPNTTKRSTNHGEGDAEVAHANEHTTGKTPPSSDRLQETRRTYAPEVIARETGLVSDEREQEGTLMIASVPEGAEVFVDSIGRGKAPTTLSVKSGKHSIQLVLAGRQDWVQEVFVDAGKSTATTVNLRPGGSALPEGQNTVSPTPATGRATAAIPFSISVAPPPHGSNAGVGTISVTSNPDGAQIFVDSVGHGVAPAILQLPSGKHSIQLVSQGYKDWTSDLAVKENSIVNVTAKFEH